MCEQHTINLPACSLTLICIADMLKLALFKTYAGRLPTRL